ncbi:hypothetical protein ASPVEDRAFT_36966 [Aspergillus versicolor CBS 583.65]|uniref:Uncharacterized protein n=1 Tax=Aspergillus versicolor CBS 583.65 TaxID=1036611 RepID=A0A1L9P7W5_ASPVE|nr:uncharacterized protein ASPVEDRAFT_36966 [Aspergillus versicolor CBS 583.65]OJI97543.1 hypothetical protein ASPVEDRAFT_36966 [Aspergillus versicolor CBS 583.65]
MGLSRGTARGFCLVGLGGSFCTSVSGVDLAGRVRRRWSVFWLGRKARYLGWIETFGLRQCRERKDDIKLDRNMGSHPTDTDVPDTVQRSELPEEYPRILCRWTDPFGK